MVARGVKSFCIQGTIDTKIEQRQTFFVNLAQKYDEETLKGTF